MEIYRRCPGVLWIISKEFYPYLTEREEKIIKVFAKHPGHYETRWSYYDEHDFKTIYKFSSLVRKGWVERIDNIWGKDTLNYVYCLTPTAIEAL